MAVSNQVRKELLSILHSKDWFNKELEKEIPSKWEKHGDLILFPEKTFATLNVWSKHPDIFETTCKLLKCTRLARRIGPTQSDNFRSPKIQLLFGNSTWVTKKENGVFYSWDLSKCMFSSGNITEKQRIAKWDLRDKTVVDMYAGIGYFTLTYLVHCNASMVYACEWNPDALVALEKNVMLHKISPERCKILSGDNRQTCPVNVADHVNLGLIPNSEAGWPTACAALKKELGGILHVHGNVDVKLCPQENLKQFNSCNMDHSASSLVQQSMYSEWSNYVVDRIQNIFSYLYPKIRWKVSIVTVIKIKSFAPHVDHVVADVLCEPELIQEESNKL